MLRTIFAMACVLSFSQTQWYTSCWLLTAGGFLFMGCPKERVHPWSYAGNLLSRYVINCLWQFDSSYSSLDWVLSHWAHFTVRRFICVCVYLCFFCLILHSCCIIVSTVGWTWWDWSLIFWTYLPSVVWHCWLGHMTRKNPSPIWPIMCLVGR